MSILGWYYLHENGSLIHKRELGGTAADIRESSFARALWPIDPQDREGAWRIAVESLAAGAHADRVHELAQKWGLTDQDAHVYAERVGVSLFRDGNAWGASRKDFINIQESPVGFGSTCLEAMAKLCKELGYKPAKMWGQTFADLLACPHPTIEPICGLDGEMVGRCNECKQEVTE